MNKTYSKSLLLCIIALIYTCFINACTIETDEEGSTINPYYSRNESLQGRERDYLTDSVLIVAHWNIGHFSQGKSSDTRITAQETDSLKELYNEMINKVNTDIMGICEYNPTFNTKGDNTSQLLFSSFPYCYIGKKYYYNCNSIFSHLPLYNCTLYKFPEAVQTRYFSVADFMLKDKTVKFVETHLDFNQGANGTKCRLSQMKELADAFKDYSYVIICADYNSKDREEYNVFLDAGFSLATNRLPNSGSPSSDDSQIMIDNIIVKGFQVKETIVYPHNSLSDHDLIWCRLRIME